MHKNETIRFPLYINIGTKTHPIRYKFHPKMQLLAKNYSYSSKEIKYEEKDLTNMLGFQIIGE